MYHYFSTIYSTLGNMDTENSLGQMGKCIKDIGTMEDSMAEVRTKALMALNEKVNGLKEGNLSGSMNEGQSIHFLPIMIVYSAFIATKKYSKN